MDFCGSVDVNSIDVKGGRMETKRYVLRGFKYVPSQLAL